MSERLATLLLLTVLAAPAAAVDAGDQAEAGADADLALELPEAPSRPGASEGTVRPAKPPPQPRRKRRNAPRTEITLDDAVDMPSDL